MNATTSEPVRAVDYKRLRVESTAFPEGGLIPERYTCDGKNISPPFIIHHIPEETVCLALIMEDPDAPGGTWVHWLLWNMPVTSHIDENYIHGVKGLNDFGTNNYRGPCPPDIVHRYFFKLYALNELLDLPAGSRKYELTKSMSSHIVAFGEYSGLYKRNEYGVEGPVAYEDE